MASPAASTPSVGSRFASAFPGSRKVYVDGGRVRVPMREITLSGGEPPLRVYDTSGPHDADVRAGLPPLRRDWIAAIGAGLLVTAAGKVIFSPGVAAAEIPPSTRLHLGEDGSIIVLTGKVEVGQGARTEILQAAAEELRVAPGGLRVMLADTAVTPNDGSTAGSRTTPSTVPVVRRACAAAREMLVRVAAERWNLDASQLRVECPNH